MSVLVDGRKQRRRRPAKALLRVMATGALMAALLPVGAMQARAATTSGPTTTDASNGIGVAPAFFRFDDAFRGGTYSDTLILENGEPRDLRFELSVEGPAASWITFTTPEDRTTPLKDVVVAGRHSVTLRVQVQVPATAANNAYQALISIRSRSVGADGNAAQSGSSLGLGAAVNVDIGVTGTQRRSGGVADFAVDPAEVGMTQRFVAQVRNQGNVLLRPTLSVEIISAPGVAGSTTAPIAKLDTSAELFPVDPGQTAVVYTSWDTGVQRGGDYIARYRLVDTTGSDVLALGSGEVKFRLEPRGTFTRSGRMDALELTNRPQPGELAQLAARFVNSGEIETNAMFVGQVYQDGKLVHSIESPPRLARAGETVSIEFSFATAEQAADFKVVGKVNFDGQLTSSKQVSFSVRSARSVGSTAGSGATSKRGTLVALGAAAVLVAAVALMRFRVRRRRRPASLVTR